jgi:hypothetical protein
MKTFFLSLNDRTTRDIRYILNVRLENLLRNEKTFSIEISI